MYKYLFLLLLLPLNLLSQTEQQQKIIDGLKQAENHLDSIYHIKQYDRFIVAPITSDSLVRKGYIYVFGNLKNYCVRYHFLFQLTSGNNKLNLRSLEIKQRIISDKVLNALKNPIGFYQGDLININSLFYKNHQIKVMKGRPYYFVFIDKHNHKYGESILPIFISPTPFPKTLYEYILKDLLDLHYQ